MCYITQKQFLNLRGQIHKKCVRNKKQINGICKVILLKHQNEKKSYTNHLVSLLHSE